MTQFSHVPTTSPQLISPQRAVKQLKVETLSCCTWMRFDDDVCYTAAYCSCGSRYKPTQSTAIVPTFQTELINPGMKQIRHLTFTV